MSWRDSDRRARLPNDWHDIRRHVLARDPMCKIRGTGCLGWSTECDHIVHGDNHALTNLQGVCAKCHATKSAREGNAARAKKYSRKYPR